MTPYQLYEWAAENIKATSFKYCSLDDYKRQEIFLEERFQQSRTIPGTRKLHSFIPLTRSKVCTKVYSTSTTCKEERVTATEDELDIEDIQGFITCVHNEQWWLACVLTVNEEDNDVRASFLHPPGPS